MCGYIDCRSFFGPEALAAVGSSFPLMTFLTSILLGLAMGAAQSFLFVLASLGSSWIKKKESLHPLFSLVALLLC